VRADIPCSEHCREHWSASLKRCSKFVGKEPLDCAKDTHLGGWLNVTCMKLACIKPMITLFTGISEMRPFSFHPPSTCNPVQG
jgi:hypothetical protein